MAVDVAALIASLSDAPDVSQGPLLVRVVWTLLALSILVVSLRLYGKITTARKLYIDDWLMIAALACAIVHASIIQVAVNNGFGRHIIYIPLATLRKTMKYGALSLLWGFLSPTLGRVSFSCTLLFLTGTDTRLKTWPVYTSIVLQLAVNLVGIIVFYAQCGTNLDTFWTFEKQLKYDEYCWRPRIQTDYGYFMGAYNTFTDVYLAILPAILVHRTTMSFKRKLGVAILLCMSSLAMISSIVKTYEAKSLSEVTDYTYNLAIYVIAMAVELNIVIIAASVPFLRPLFRRKPPRLDLPGLHQVPPPLTWNSHIPLSSGFTSKNHSRTNTVTEEELGVLPGTQGTAWAGEVEGVITVTTEVEVTYQRMEAPYVHAALVGLIQGELANPRLVQI